MLCTWWVLLRHRLLVWVRTFFSFHPGSVRRQASPKSTHRRLAGDWRLVTGDWQAQVFQAFASIKSVIRAQPTGGQGCQSSKVLAPVASKDGMNLNSCTCRLAKNSWPKHVKGSPLACALHGLCCKALPACLADCPIASPLAVVKYPTYGNS